MHTQLFSCGSSLKSSIVIFAVFFILIAINQSCYGQEDNERYYECSNRFYNCGQTIQNISYPFWGGNRPQWCGHQELELTCDNNEYSIINIRNRPYRVLNIEETSLAMTVASTGLWDDYCTRDQSNVSLNSSSDHLLSYSPTTRPLYVFYNCSSEITGQFPNTSFDCPPVDGGTVGGRGLVGGRGFYANESSLRTRPEITSLNFPTSELCREAITVPVLATTLEKLSNKELKFQEALKLGFELLYDALAVNCSRCEGSGGLCGSDTTSHEFVCHCRDGSHPQDCRSTVGSCG